MTFVRASFCLAVAFFAGCESASGPPVAISEVRVLAPMPGSTAGVAYLTVTNDGPDAVTIRNIRSPQFDRIEIHETAIDDQGVSRMRQLQSVVVDPGETLQFAEGGKHLMMMGAQPDTRAGSPVTLEIEHSLGLLIVTATLQNRVPSE